MTNQRRGSALAMIGLLSTGFLALGGPTESWAADSAKVVIKDFMYMPMTLTVKAGTTVTWVNRDDEPHTVVSSAGLFRSGGLDTNESYSYRFDKPGTYGIVCSIHPRMVATIVVE